MVERTESTVIQKEDPQIAAYKLGLYQDAQKYIRDLQAQGIQPPAQGIAGFTSEQLAAGDVIRSGIGCLLYTSPSPRDGLLSRMPSSA